MMKVYTIWAAYLKYGSIMKCVMLDDHLKEVKEAKKEKAGPSGYETGRKEKMQKYFAGELQQWQEKAYRAEDGIFYLVTDVEAAAKEKEAAIQKGCQIIAEGIKVVEGLEEQIAALTESRDEWKRQWRLIEAAEKMAEEKIAALQEETSRLYAITVEQDKQIAALNDALSGRDGIIEKLKGYLANKKTDITEKVEYINSLTEELAKARADEDSLWKERDALTAENKRLKQRETELKHRLGNHGDLETEEEDSENALKGKGGEEDG